MDEVVLLYILSAAFGHYWNYKDGSIWRHKYLSLKPRPGRRYYVPDTDKIMRSKHISGGEIILEAFFE